MLPLNLKYKEIIFHSYCSSFPLNDPRLSCKILIHPKRCFMHLYFHLELSLRFDIFPIISLSVTQVQKTQKTVKQSENRGGVNGFIGWCFQSVGLILISFTEYRYMNFPAAWKLIYKNKQNKINSIWESLRYKYNINFIWTLSEAWWGRKVSVVEAGLPSGGCWEQTKLRFCSDLERT